jgi:glutathione S-transferase
MILVQYPGLERGGTFSPPCAKVQMALRFKGLSFETRNIRSPMEAKRYNPRGRVPVLLIGDERIVDSTDILTELDRRFPVPPFLPADPEERVRVKILEDWADEVLYFYGVYYRWLIPENFERMRTKVLSRQPIPIRWVLPAFALREVRKRARGQGVGLKDEPTIRQEIEECLDAIEILLTRSSALVGDAITRADLAVAAVVDQWMFEALTPDLAGSIRARPRTVAWLDRVHAVAPNAAR